MHCLRLYCLCVLDVIHSIGDSQVVCFVGGLLQQVQQVLTNLDIDI